MCAAHRWHWRWRLWAVAACYGAGAAIFIFGVSCVEFKHSGPIVVSGLATMVAGKILGSVLRWLAIRVVDVDSEHMTLTNVSAKFARALAEYEPPAHDGDPFEQMVF